MTDLDIQDNVISISAARTKRRAGEFVKTHTAQMILNSLAYTLREEDLAVIHGEPGVGKTRTIQAFKEDLEKSRNSAAWVTTIAPSIATVVPMLTAIAHTIGASTHEGGARHLHNAIVERLSSVRRVILIIDESQHLKKASLEELRALHDASGCAVALVGNEEVYRRLAQHPQLYSRVGVRLKLQKPQESDVKRLVVTRWGQGISDEAFELLDEVSQLPGALRLVVKVMNASDAKNKRNAEGIRQACKMLGVEIGGGAS